MASAGERGGQQVAIDSLSVQQLSQLKKQFDGEIEQLQGSYTALKSAQNKFKDCKITLRKTFTRPTSKTADENQILVPLTTSLYVPGKLASTDTVLVDVGTGFYVEKAIDDAQSFYDRKIEQLGKNLKDLENIVQAKGNTLRVVEEVLRQKVLAQGQGGDANGTKAAAS